MSNIIIALFTGAIIALVSSSIANIFSERRDRRKDFNKAAKEFRANFTDEVKLFKRHCLGDDSGNITSHILDGAIEKHETAKINFRPYLSRTEKNGFDRAWRNYALVDDDDGWDITPDKAIHKYYSYENTLIEFKMRKLARISIKWLLFYANPK